jgi:asparagine N-glycosylation enzyme membrane subunit Stt3
VIAQVIPSEGVSPGLYSPLWLAAVVYVALLVGSHVLAGRGDDRAEGVADAAFGVMLLTAAYAVVLLVIALVSESGLVQDLFEITLIVVAFFALLGLFLLALFEGGIGGISRLRRRR